MSEAIITSEQAAQSWPLPDVDLTNLDLFSRGFPHQVFTDLRSHHGALFHPRTALTPDGEGFWVFTRYHDIAAIAKDNDTFSSAGGGDRQGGGTMIEDLPREMGPGSVINMMDDPRHKALRRLIGPALTNARVAAMEDILFAAAESAVQAALQQERVDFVSAIAAELPLFAIASLVGIPQDDRHQIFAWINAVLDYSDRQLGETSISSQQGMKNFMAYGHKFVDEKRQNPGSDIVSLAVTGELPKGLGKLTPLEQLMVFSVVMVAGLETTRNAIAGGILAFIHHPEQWLRLQQDGGLMNSALDEILRWTSPTPYNRRTATRDVIIGDRLIRRGEKVTLWWASANRDDAYYEQPFTFDIGRQKNLHLAFGGGGHSCLGAQLARLEMRVILHHLLEQVHSFSLDGEVNWVRSNKHTGIRSMLVRFVKRY
ncbi:cytochrome P450 [Salmonella enterica]|uniref:Cytochrome P450 n=1 Tax=Salmonella enterica I TaxID=59201 RepID=A0A615QYP8_SALET|nr:cytochrome P450 [Salmonella enterica subsp. enterica serovar Kingabwa]EFT9957313.1 cytochrome P450 [Salmonella enterica]